MPRLRFWHWHNFNVGPDYGEVQVKVGAGSWVTVSPRYVGANNGWIRPSLDLLRYAGQTVQLGFFFHAQDDSPSSPEVSSGWYIDDVMIQVGNIGLAEIADKVVNEHVPLSFPVAAVGASANSSLAFSLPSAPKGAWVDPETGVFTWTPGERQGPGVHFIPIYLVDYGNGEANEMTTVKITVNEVNEAPWLVSSVIAVEPGQTVHLPLLAGDRDYPKNPLRFTMTGAPAGATLTTNTGVFRWVVPASSPPATYPIRVTLTDNGSPNYAAASTLTLTVTRHANYWFEIRHLTEQDFEFTIHDTAATEDYVLQQAVELKSGVRWVANGDAVPPWLPAVPEDDYLEDSSWDDFLTARLQTTLWEDVRRVSPTTMPFSFTHTVAGGAAKRAMMFRVVRVPR
jgi:hypothetical protein